MDTRHPTKIQPPAAGVPYSYEQLIAYIRAKVNQLLEVMGTLPLDPEELDDKDLLDLDPIGIVTESFRQVIGHLRETNTDLVLARNELHAMLDAAGAAIVAVDENFQVQAANDLANHLFSDDSGNVEGLCFCECAAHVCCRDGALERLVASGEGSQSWDVVVNGRDFHMMATAFRVSDAEPAWLILIFTDITERKQDEEKLKQAAAVFDATAEAIIVTDRDANITAVNRAFTVMTGYAAAEMVGCNPRLLQSGRHDRAFYATIWKSLECSGHWQGEIWDRRKDGEIFPAWQAISAVRDEHGEVVTYVSILSDISVVKQSQEQLDFLAHHDTLTALPNRVLFNDRLRHAMDVSRRDGTMLGLVFIDLDRFKTINDSLGHPLGDKLLVQAAKRIQQHVRTVDTVARLGGDEFVILIEHLGSAQDVARLCQKIIDAFQQPLLVDGHELHLTMSMGISLFPRDGDDAATLIKHADAAMYRAKDEGRNVFQFFTQELSITAFERLTLETALRHALEFEQLELYYQPQYALADGRLVGAEALLRWNHPDLGVVAPDKFIPVAEENGLILPIGEWVLRQACADARRWRDAGYVSQRVAVNISAVQIQRGDIVAAVQKALHDSGLPAVALELEITESVIMQRPEQAKRVLHRLRELGITIAIDDFGTGYSSLSQLKRLPVDRLKIDRNFVRDVVTDGDDEAIVHAVIALGRAMHLEIMAEGVEESAQQHFLCEAGCHGAQGYLFGRPEPAPMFEARLEEEKG
ncbi:MAG: EAL domain-containing protein [Gammaproteobacteria bacterium]